MFVQIKQFFYQHFKLYVNWLGWLFFETTNIFTEYDGDDTLNSVQAENVSDELVATDFITAPGHLKCFTEQQS